MTEAECLERMVPPGQRRPTAWRGGIIQVHLTRACDLACFACTQGSNLGGKPVMLTVGEFELACQSLKGYWGVVGIFGGNPTLNNQFEDICNVLCKYFPKQQRGLWCNHPKGHGKLMRQVFNPRVSNLNVHLSQEAYDEFKRDWPESQPFGLHEDSRHATPWVSMVDVAIPEEQRWEAISRCDINQNWSAMICKVPTKGLRAFFCEIAGAQAMLHGAKPNYPDTGLALTVDWWKQPMATFVEQVKHHCHNCGIPLRRHGQLAVNGEHEEVSATHADIYKPKDRHRPVTVITKDGGQKLGVVTDYIGNSQK